MFLHNSSSKPQRNGLREHCVCKVSAAAAAAAVLRVMFKVGRFVPLASYAMRNSIQIMLRVSDSRHLVYGLDVLHPKQQRAGMQSSACLSARMYKVTYHSLCAVHFQSRHTGQTMELQ